MSGKAPGAAPPGRAAGDACSTSGAAGAATSGNRAGRACRRGGSCGGAGSPRAPRARPGLSGRLTPRAPARHHRRLANPENLIGEDSDLRAAVGEVVLPHLVGPGSRRLAHLGGLAERFAHPAAAACRRRPGARPPGAATPRPSPRGRPSSCCRRCRRDPPWCSWGSAVLIDDVAGAVGALEDLRPGRARHQRHQRTAGAPRPAERPCAAARLRARVATMVPPLYRGRAAASRVVAPLAGVAYTRCSRPPTMPTPSPLQTLCRGRARSTCPPLPSPPRLPGHPGRLQSPLRAVSRLRARRQEPFRGRQLARHRAHLAGSHRFLRSPRSGDRRAAGARVRLRPDRRRPLGGGQAPLHRAA